MLSKEEIEKLKVNLKHAYKVLKLNHQVFDVVIEKAIKYIEQLEADNYANNNIISEYIDIVQDKDEYIEELQEENTKLKQMLEAGLNKEKRYCFNEDGKTGMCLGYSNYNDDEPCDYCKNCEKINTKE